MTVREAVTFASLLRRHRLAAMLSQETLAERAQLSVSAISALERGYRSAPRAETVALLADALGLDGAERSALIDAAVAARRHGEAVPAPGTENGDTPSGAQQGNAALPVPPTPLIGREAEIREITRLLEPEGAARLVTLTGPGGVGKTRLAIAVAQSLRTCYRDGAQFVDLSSLRDPALVAQAIASSLGLREVGAQRPDELLVAHLRARHALLVLDNVEQVIAAAPCIGHLVLSCSGLAILATSRVALRLRAEQIVRVGPLGIPRDPRAEWHAIAGVPAVSLFVARAMAVRPDFALHAENGAAVGELCRRLDGLPLAIELAAARVSLLSPPALLERLERRLPILKAGARDLPARQQTMRATIDWSYSLLTERERAVFRRLSIFAGGCTIEAAESIARPDAVSIDDLFAALEALVDHSLLLSSVQSDGEPRFQMLDTIREYGLEQLAACGELDATRRGHADHFLRLAEEARSRLFGPDQVRWLEALEREHDNCAEAMTWAYGNGDAERSLALAGALWRFWYLRCYLTEGRNRLQRAVELPNAVAASLRLEAIVGLAVIAYAQADYDAAAAAADRGVAEARSLDDPTSLVVLLNIMGGVARYRSDFARAAALGEECVALTRALGDRWSLALSLTNLAEVLRFQGEHARATGMAAESKTHSRSLNDRWGLALAHLILGRIARDLGKYAESAARFEEALAIVRELGHTRDIAVALAGLGYAAHAQGDHGDARERLEASLVMLRPLGDALRMADVALDLGSVRLAIGEPAAAAGLFREALATYQAMGNRLGVARCLEAFAGLARRRGSLDGAALGAQLLAAAEQLRGDLGSPRAPSERGGIDAEGALLADMLGPRRFAQEESAGRAMPLHEIVGRVLFADDRSA